MQKYLLHDQQAVVVKLVLLNAKIKKIINNNNQETYYKSNYGAW